MQAVTQSTSGFLQADSDIHNAQQEQAEEADKKAAVSAQQKAMQAAAKAKESWKKVQTLAKSKSGVNAVKLGKVDDKELKNRSDQPPANEKI